MAAEAEARMNAAAVRRVDPYAKDIVETCSHVALYSFDDNEWTKTDVEGALFLYSRSGRPFHNLLVMNRLSTRNLIEPVTRGLELQLQAPFLLYRNSERRIYGLWFFDKQECSRVAAKIERLVRDQPAPVEEPRKPLDLFSMLSKAQDQYNNSRVASQSVADFFAAAARPPGPPATTPQAETASNCLQRLISGPVPSVEHIEKQQRSTTPERRSPKPEAETPKPALMPPTMFTSSAVKAKETPVRPEPLTRNQLLQAMDYLIKHDADFMTKLHEAYVKSFSELVS